MIAFVESEITFCILSDDIFPLSKSISANIGFAPAYQIKSNAELEQTVEEINVLTKKACNLLEEGIIDPTRVIVQSLKNAFASYELLINTNYIINNEGI